MMKKLHPLIIAFILIAIPVSSIAGERVDGSKVLLLNSVNNRVYAMISTNEKGEFGLIDIEKGDYILQIELPVSSLLLPEKDSLKLLDLITSACDKEQGRLIFQYRKNCFVFDLDCEFQKLSKFDPNFSISKKEGTITISIASARVEGNSDFKGLFQHLTIKSYERCFKSGKFQILEN